MLPIFGLLVIAVVIFFFVFATKKKNQGQDLGDRNAGAWDLIIKTFYENTDSDIRNFFIYRLQHSGANGKNYKKFSANSRYGP